jgi:hypothetical protein
MSREARSLLGPRRGPKVSLEYSVQCSEQNIPSSDR